MKQFLTSFLFLVVSCVGMAPMLAPAQVQTCGPGLNCVSASFRAPPQSRASFPTCTNSIAGQQRFDGDGGVPMTCAYGQWAPTSGWRAKADTSPYSTGSAFVPLLHNAEAFPYSLQGYPGESGLTFWDDTLVTLYGGSTGVEIHAQASGSPDDHTQQIIYPGSWTVNADATGAVTATARVNAGPPGDNGFSINNTAPVSGLPEASFWYDGGSSLEPGNTYVQAVIFGGAKLHDICLVEQAIDARSNSYRLMTHCAVESANRVRISYYNPGAGNANLTCAFSDPNCGYRVRLIQRH